MKHMSFTGNAMHRSGYSIVTLALLTFHSFSDAQIVNIADISTVKVNLVNHPAIDGQNVTEFICIGSLEIDILVNQYLLLGLCTPPTLALSGAIGILPYVDNRIVNQTLSESAVEVLYGNLTAAEPTPATTQTEWDTGIGNEMTILQPEHLYQTGDIIYFVDSRSCLRKVNRTTHNVTTIIGICGSGTLGIMGASDELVYGMTYIEEKDMFVFAIVNMGVYVFTSNGSSRMIVDRPDISSTVNDAIRYIVKGNGAGNQVIWHKIRQGINMYNLIDINATDGELIYQQTFVRYISATGSSIIDTTARRRNETDPELGAFDAVLDVSPDGETLLIADMNLHRLYFLQLLPEVNMSVDQVAPLQAVCDRETDMSAISNNLDNCTFHGITSALWADEYTILVFERYAGSFRIVRLQEPETMTTTTTMPTTPTTPTTTTTQTTTTAPTTTAVPTTTAAPTTTAVPTTTTTGNVTSTYQTPDASSNTTDVTTTDCCPCTVDPTPLPVPMVPAWYLDIALGVTIPIIFILLAVIVYLLLRHAHIHMKVNEGNSPEQANPPSPRPQLASPEPKRMKVNEGSSEPANPSTPYPQLRQSINPEDNLDNFDKSQAKEENETTKQQRKKKKKRRGLNPLKAAKP